MAEGEVGSSAEIKLLVKDVEENDGHLASALRIVLERNIDTEAFVTSLEDAYRERDKEIERKCTDNYDKFVSSITDLLDLRASANGLGDAIDDCTAVLETNGASLVDSAQTLAQTRRTQRNILVAIEALSFCTPVLRLFDQAEVQLAQKRYYPALKSLQELEARHLPRVMKYSFARTMRQNIPRMRLQVKQAAFADMRSFLSRIRDFCGEIGEAAMRQTAAGQAAVTDGEASDVKTKFEVAASDKVDFAPLYRCLHLCDVLGCMPECIKYYKEERNKQAQLVLHPVVAMDSTSGYKRYFNDVAGFFLAEDTVLSTTSGFTTRQWVDGVWQTALIKISKVMEQQLAKCSTASMIREVKDVIVLLNNTLMGYDYSVTRLVDILLQVRKRYQAVIVRASAEALKAILEEDDYAPIVVEDEAQYKEVMANYPIEDRVFQEAPFPKTFPFSRAVPRLYAEIKQHINLSHGFVEDLGLSNTDVDDMVRQATNHLLSKVLSSLLAGTAQTRHLTLPQLTQISVNTTHLEKSCNGLERYITSLTGSIGNEVHNTRLHGADYFKDARSAAERQIFSLLQAQIDQFLELADYDWTPAEPKTDSSEYIFDMLAYLTTIFASLTNLPKEVAKAAYFNTCKYISSQLLDLVQSPEIKRVNLNGIMSFAKDVETCEEYAENCPLVGEGDDLFKGVFVHLRELVDLFLSMDFEAYCSEEGRRDKYPHLRPHIVLQWLEKFDDTGGRRFFKSSGDRKKTREVDAVIKRLRAISG